MEAPQQYPETSYSLGLNNCGVGDVNGDGFSDYLVYRPISGIHDSTDTLDAFTTLLFLGNSVLSQEPALVYSRNLSGADSACGMGYVMAGLGDVNGDGYDDYAISAPHAITDTVPSQGIVRGGKVYVHFGGPMPDTIPDLIIKGDWRRRIAWWSLCGADVNGNGYNDLIIGSSEWGMWPGDGGRVDIYYGGVSMDTIPDKTILGGIHIGGMESEQFGWCIDNCGDVNNDGYEDIIVGAPSNHQRNECAGKAYLFFGGKNMDLEPDWWFYGENLHQFLGEMVSDAGDFNGDGYDDFMIGDRFYPHFYNSYGRVLLFFGGPVLDTIPSWVINGHFWLGPNCTNDLGSNVDALGDVNNDGYDDLLIGNSKYRHYGECPGRILLYYGGEEPDTLPDIEYIGEIGYERATGLNLCNAGDVNGDGINDILFGNNYPPIVPFPDFYGWVRIMKYVETAVPDTVLVKGGDCYVICRWNDHHINNTILYQLFRCINPDTSGWQLAGECQPKIAFDHQIIDRNVGFDESRYYWLKITAQSGLTDLFGPYPASASAMEIELDVAWQPGDVIELKWQPAGVQEIVWDGCDDQNRRLSAGIYYCMYQMGGNKNTTKIVLLK